MSEHWVRHNIYPHRSEVSFRHVDPRKVIQNWTAVTRFLVVFIDEPDEIGVIFMSWSRDQVNIVVFRKEVVT